MFSLTKLYLRCLNHIEKICLFLFFKNVDNVTQKLLVTLGKTLILYALTGEFVKTILVTLTLVRLADVV